MLVSKLGRSRKHRSCIRSRHWPTHLIEYETKSAPTPHMTSDTPSITHSNHGGRPPSPLMMEWMLSAMLQWGEWGSDRSSAIEDKECNQGQIYWVPAAWHRGQCAAVSQQRAVCQPHLPKYANTAHSYRMPTAETTVNCQKGMLVVAMAMLSCKQSSGAGGAKG